MWTVKKTLGIVNVHSIDMKNLLSLTHFTVFHYNVFISEHRLEENKIRNPSSNYYARHLKNSFYKRWDDRQYKLQYVILRQILPD